MTDTPSDPAPAMAPANPEPANPDYESHVRQAFAAQGLMQSFGATLDVVEPGRIVIGQAFGAHLLQQHGGLHGGAIAALLDTACGFAGVTLLPAGRGITTIEFKTNFLAPGLGPRFRIEGTILKAGRTLQVAQGRMEALAEGAAPRLIAVMTATQMVIDL